MKKVKESEAKIEFFYTPDCNVWRKALPVLKEALKEMGLKEPSVKVIKTQEEADKFKFTGSPTIKVKGIDLIPEARNASRFTSMGCRIIWWKGKAFEFPSKEMIIEEARKLLEMK